MPKQLFTAIAAAEGAKTFAVTLYINDTGREPDGRLWVQEHTLFPRPLHPYSLTTGPRHSRSIKAPPHRIIELVKEFLQMNCEVWPYPDAQRELFQAVDKWLPELEQLAKP